MKVILFSFVLLSLIQFAQTALSAPNSSGQVVTVINEILLAEGGDSWTTRDLQLYKFVLKNYLKKDRLTEFSENSMDDFMISRVLKREAQQFDLDPIYIDRSQVKFDLAVYSKLEIEEELSNISLALSILNLKEKQIGQKARFRAWIDVLKRKYNVKFKAEYTHGAS